MMRKNPVSSQVSLAIGSGALQPYGTIAAASACNKEDRFAPLSSSNTVPSTVFRSRIIYI